MVEHSALRRLNRYPGTIAGTIVGLSAAVAAALLPTWRLESLVLDSGLPALFPPAAPPLGLTARLALIVVTAAIAGGGTGLAVRWLAPVRRTARTAARRADQHPDAPVREPVMAMRDLGTPFLDVGTGSGDPAPMTIEQDLPGDLNMPLAAFDPAAIPAQPMTPSAPVAPLFRPEPDMAPPADAVPPRQPVAVEPFERTAPPRPYLSAVPLPLPVHDEDGPITTIETEATVHALLDRLERGVRRRGGRPIRVDHAMKGELDEALATLKHFATAG